MQSLNRNGANLAYQEAGSGAAPILLVHGFCGNHAHLAPQFDYFRRNHRVVAVDRRGHGESDKPEQPYTIEGFADDLAWLCRELGIYKPIVVVHSMGAIGLELAARRSAHGTGPEFCFPRHRNCTGESGLEESVRGHRIRDRPQPGRRGAPLSTVLEAVRVPCRVDCHTALFRVPLGSPLFPVPPVVQLSGDLQCAAC